MPLYDFRCSEGHTFEKFVPLEKFEEEVFCPCQRVAKRVISAPMFRVDHTGYNCPITGNWIGSKRQHEENLKRHDCRVLETGEKEANDRVREEKEAAFEKSVDESIDRELSTWSSDKMEKLSNELVNGNITATVERA